MAHQLVFGEIYFIGNDQWEIKKKVNTKEYKLTPEQKKMVSPEFEDFVTKCLIKNKDQRMRADQLCSHPLFKASRAKELEIPVAVKNAHNNYFVKSIKQLVYKSVFLAEVSKSIAETGRKTLFATMYLAKKSLCFASLLESKLSKALSPFECDKNAWTIFLTSKDFRDATQFVTAVRTNVLTFFNAVYQQFKQYISRFSR
jgi:serine/threonine protein kinase